LTLLVISLVKRLVHLGGNMSELQKRGGWAAIAGGLLAIAGDGVVLASGPSVANDRVSYPLTTHAFQAGQVFFALTQALVAVGIVAWSGRRPCGRAVPRASSAGSRSSASR